MKRSWDYAALQSIFLNHGKVTDFLSIFLIFLYSFNYSFKQDIYTYILYNRSVFMNTLLFGFSKWEKYPFGVSIQIANEKFLKYCSL